jgi:hypothetical protein
MMRPSRFERQLISKNCIFLLLNNHENNNHAKHLRGGVVDTDSYFSTYSLFFRQNHQIFRSL